MRQSNPTTHPLAACLQVYTVAGGKNIPSWLSEKNKAKLRKDEEYGRRVELMQDFEFPAACQRIKITPDGQFIFATGYHPPRVRRVVPGYFMGSQWIGSREPDSSSRARCRQAHVACWLVQHRGSQQGKACQGCAQACRCSCILPMHLSHADARV